MSYIPSTDNGSNVWLTNFAVLLTATPATYGLLAGDAVLVTNAQVAYSDALTLSQDPNTRTPVTVAAKDAARASAEFVARPYAVNISLNPSVSNGDKVAIGVTVRSNIPTPIPAPVTAPTIALISAMPLVQQLQVRPTGASNKAKPQGAVAIEIARSVGTVAATDPSQLRIVGQYGRTPLLQDFASEDQGKIVTYAARYKTRSGPGGVAQNGPWSNLVTFVVI